MMKKIILIVLSILFTFSLFAETIILKSGKRIEGKIIERNDEYIKVDFYGVPLTYYFEDIESIDGKSIFPQTINTKKSSAQDFRPKLAKDIFRLYASAVVRIQTDKGFGSGFIIDKSGIIVTNYHVIDKANTIKVILKDKTKYTPTRVLNYDILKDLCILKIDVEKELPFIPLGDSESIEIGESAFVIGSPAGYEYTISDGIVSQHREEIFRSLVQFTCPISPGSSGGPLLDSTGRAIGVVTRLIFSYDNIPVQNINFAISSREVQTVLSQKQNIKIDDFIKKMKDLSLFTQALSTPDQDALLIYLDFYKQCGRDLNNRNCFQAYMQMLRIMAVAMTETYNLAISNKQSLKDPLKWVNSHIKLIEDDAGGLDTVASKYELYLRPSTEALNNTKELIIAAGYYLGGIFYAMEGDLTSAQNCLTKLKAFVPNSLAVAGVEEIIHKARYQTK